MNGNSDQTGSDWTQTEIAQNWPFHVNWAGKYFNQNLVGFLGIISELPNVPPTTSEAQQYFFVLLHEYTA